MGTRCNVLFQSKGQKILIYKGNDGYPEGESGMIAFLREFFIWQGMGNGIGVDIDLDMMASNFIFFGKLKSMQSVNKLHKLNKKPLLTVASLLKPKRDTYANDLSGYAICPPNAKNVDHAYIYLVNVYDDRVEICIRESWDKPLLAIVTIGGKGEPSPYININ